MPLRHELERLPETLQELELAAESRFYEAQALLTQGHYAGSIYLAGYVAEILLKCAYCYSSGARPLDIAQGYFAPARRFGKAWCPGIEHESYHSLRFWLSVLRARRRYTRPIDAHWDNQLVRRVQRLYQIWWYSMRYHPDYALLEEARRALDDAAWLRNNYSTYRR